MLSTMNIRMLEKVLEIFHSLVMKNSREKGAIEGGGMFSAGRIMI